MRNRNRRAWSVDETREDTGTSSSEGKREPKNFLKKENEFFNGKSGHNLGASGCKAGQEVSFATNIGVCVPFKALLSNTIWIVEYGLQSNSSDAGQNCSTQLFLKHFLSFFDVLHVRLTLSVKNTFSNFKCLRLFGGKRQDLWTCRLSCPMQSSKDVLFCSLEKYHGEEEEEEDGKKKKSGSDACPG